MNGRVHGKERSRMTNKKVTIKDVANDSGVSITTVSQILNGNGARFSGKTGEKWIGNIRYDYANRLTFFHHHTLRKIVGLIV